MMKKIKRTGMIAGATFLFIFAAISIVIAEGTWAIRDEWKKRDE